MDGKRCEAGERGGGAGCGGGRARVCVCFRNLRSRAGGPLERRRARFGGPLGAAGLQQRQGRTYSTALLPPKGVWKTCSDTWRPPCLFPTFPPQRAVYIVLAADSLLLNAGDGSQSSAASRHLQLRRQRQRWLRRRCSCEFWSPGAFAAEAPWAASEGGCARDLAAHLPRVTLGYVVAVHIALLWCGDPFSVWRQARFCRSLCCSFFQPSGAKLGVSLHGSQSNQQ